MSYYDPYQSGLPFNPNYQQQSQPTFQQTQRQHAPYQNQVQVIVPPRPGQHFSPQLSQQQPPADYHNQLQYPPQYSHYNSYQPQQPQTYVQQYPQGQNFQSYDQNHEFQLRSYPPPPPRVIVPPSPIEQQAFTPAPSKPVMQPMTQVPNRQQSVSSQPNQNQRQHETGQRKTQQGVVVNVPTYPSQPQLSPTQYPSLLLTLADEYVIAAQKLQKRTKEYYHLISTAIGCMDVALKNFKLEPLREAQLSLKYASLLFDETDNLDEVETVLTKSIELCDRLKFIDLKYAMQLLLAKVLYRSRPRAAIRDLQGMISDIETYRHTAWEYCFRFQAVSFTSPGSEQVNPHESFHQLERIQHVAKLNSDHGIYAYAAIIESLLHLQSHGQDRITNSQRSLAKARSLQLNPDVDKHPQMPVLMDIIDLIWSVNTANENEIEQKRNNLKDTIYSKSIENPAWARDESTWLRINKSSLKGIPTQEGGLVHELDGKYYIALSWMGKKELEALGFLLVGVALVPRNRLEKNKAEKFLDKGINVVVKTEMLEETPMHSGKDQALRHRCHILGMHFEAEVAFLCCNQGRWKEAEALVAQMHAHMDELSGTGPQEFESLSAYLRGCIAQGTGDLETALNMYQSNSLAMQSKHPNQSPVSKSQSQPQNQAVQTLRLLAAINTALIIAPASHPQHKHFQSLTDKIGTNITPQTRPIVLSAHSLLLSTMPNTTVLQMKQLLNTSLVAAREMANNQIISLTLTLMQDRFFRGGVQHAQAVKCAKAAMHQVKTRWGSPLWMAVAGMMEVESLILQADPATAEEFAVKRADISKKKEEFVGVWKRLPENIKSAMSAEQDRKLREAEALKIRYGME